MLPFAAMEARLNAACAKKLANATADFGAGREVDGLFGSAYGEAFGIVGGEKLVFEAESGLLAGIDQGAPVAIGGGVYQVGETRATAGWTTLTLESV